MGLLPRLVNGAPMATGAEGCCHGKNKEDAVFHMDTLVISCPAHIVPGGFYCELNVLL